MNAAIYARKSTEQSGLNQDEKSVARQIERAKTLAASRGYTVLDDHVFSDDGISGSEFERRPGLMRLMATLKRAPAIPGPLHQRQGSARP